MSMYVLFLKNISLIKISLFFVVYTFFIFSTSLFSQEKILTGGRFYIHHPLGLDLKKEPDLNSTTLQNLPYGSRIELEKEAISQKSSLENIPGFWRKVLTKKGEEAYVLDSFLSRYPTPSTNCDNLKSYLDENYKKQKVYYKDEVHSRSILTLYSGNHKHTLSKIGDTKIQKIELREGELKDGFFIGRACAHPAFRGMQFAPKGNSIEIEMQGGKYGEKHKLNISEENKMIVIIHTLIPNLLKEEEKKD